MNRQFLEDKTKIWTETKASRALHNYVMGYPHEHDDTTYKVEDLIRDFNKPKK